MIVDQNLALKIKVEEVKGHKAIKPLFRMGPKTNLSIWWVYEVSPRNSRGRGFL